MTLEYTPTPEEPCATCGATDTVLCDSCGHWYCREHEDGDCNGTPWRAPGE